MYAREVDGTVLTFFLSGLQWRQGLVLEDQETHTSWSQMLGLAVDGAQQGTKLAVFPSLFTTWGLWKSRYPATTVGALQRITNDYHRDMYEHFDHDAKMLVGLANEVNAKDWHFSDLHKQNLANDQFDGRPVIVYFDSSTGTPVIHVRQSDGQELHFFEKTSGVFDVETGSEWDLLRGVAVRGLLKGKQLTTLPAMISYIEAWRRFHPDSQSWVRSEDPK